MSGALPHLLLLALVALPLGTAQALDLTGRFSMLGTTARAGAGDIGYLDGERQTLTADQQSLRLMLDGVEQHGEWSLHLDTARLHLDGYPGPGAHSSELFRYREWAGEWLDESGERSSTRIGYALDRAFYRYRTDNLTMALGRQPLDWGSGRFWQPLNVFGAFSPIELDTDFKPGIDALSVDWYPSAYSSLTAAYVPAPKENEALEESIAVYYRRNMGMVSELSLLAGSVLGNRVGGGAFESAWKGMGWRVEGVYYHLEESDETALFWIAGLDHQFTNGTLLTAEWYHNSHGASREGEIGATLNDPLVAYGLQPQLGRRVVGLSLARDLTPLLHGSYTLLVAPLSDETDQQHTSLLHQFNLTYSVSNESDLLLSCLIANGKGVSDVEEPRSEFGHLPASLSVRLRFYF
ncbi:MAG: hypothetical protein OQK54_05025 [Gammaproteobacteria bacterium]|nr:hypothetical protein [Gammaproteobacteria bacterium]